MYRVPRIFPLPPSSTPTKQITCHTISEVLPDLTHLKKKKKRKKCFFNFPGLYNSYINSNCLQFTRKWLFLLLLLLLFFPLAWSQVPVNAKVPLPLPIFFYPKSSSVYVKFAALRLECDGDNKRGGDHHRGWGWAPHIENIPSLSSASFMVARAVWDKRGSLTRMIHPSHTVSQICFLPPPPPPPHK